MAGWLARSPADSCVRVEVRSDGLRYAEPRSRSCRRTEGLGHFVHCDRVGIGRDREGYLVVRGIYVKILENCSFFTIMSFEAQD